MSDDTGPARDEALPGGVEPIEPAGPESGAPVDDELEPLASEFDDFEGFDEPEFDETVTEQQVVMQRQPRIWRFMLLGGIIFGIAGLVVTYAMPYDAATATYDRSVVAGFVLLFAAALGLALGGVIAVLVERLTRRNARTLTAEHIEARPRS